VTPNPFYNPNFWCLLGPLAAVWLYVSAHFARNWWRRRNYVSLMLAFMPLGHLTSALRELHLLNRFSTIAVLSASLAIGGLTAFVVHHNAKMRGGR
jgi:hypothetical protein